jgi:beta-lactamase class A
MFKFLPIILGLFLSTVSIHAETLEEKLKALNVTSIQGNVGIGVLNLSTGESWFHNGNKSFPMQSVYKLPLAIVVLKQIEEKKFALETPVDVEPRHFAPFFSPIRDELKDKKGQYTVYELLRRSMSDSDNTATDVLFELVGGPEKANTYLQAMQINHIRLDRTEKQIQPEAMGLVDYHPVVFSPDNFSKEVAKLSREEKQAALEKFLQDPRDTATPEAMINLLQRLHRNELLSQDSTSLLLKIMTTTPHGKNRLKKGLPPKWTLAHKTGSGPTIVGVNTGTNDVGIAQSNKGQRFAFVVFIAGSQSSLDQHEKLMRDLVSLSTK